MNTHIYALKCFHNYLWVFSFAKPLYLGGASCPAVIAQVYTIPQEPKAIPKAELRFYMHLHHMCLCVSAVTVKKKKKWHMLYENLKPSTERSNVQFTPLKWALQQLINISLIPPALRLCFVFSVDYTNLIQNSVWLSAKSQDNMLQTCVIVIINILPPKFQNVCTDLVRVLLLVFIPTCWLAICLDDCSVL